jgi:hypothetical protein
MFDGGNFGSGIPFGSVVGLSRAFSDVDLSGVLTPQGQAMAAASAGMRVEQLMMSFPFVRLSDHLTGGGVFALVAMTGMPSALRFLNERINRSAT